MLKVSFPAKLKHSQPIATHIEVESRSLTWRGIVVTAGVAGLFCLLALKFAAVALDWSASQSHWYALTDTKKDDQAYVMAKVLSGDAAKADVIILGTSAAREALLTDIEFSAQLKQRKLKKYRTVNLATSAQSLIESLLLVDTMQPQPGQTFVFFVSPTALQQDRPFHSVEQGGFLQTPESLIQRYSQHGVFPRYWHRAPTRLLYQIRAARQKLYRLLNYRLKYWVHAKAYGVNQQNYAPYQYVGGKAHSADMRLAQIKAFEARFGKNTEANLPYVQNGLRAILEHLNSHGCRVVIARPPEFNDEFRKSFPRPNEQFETVLRELNQSIRFEQLNLNETIAWETNDFLDFTHVTQTGRIKWSNALATWLKDQAPPSKP